MKIKNINELFGMEIEFDSVDDMKETLLSCYDGEDCYITKDYELRENVDFVIID